jgi:SpoU rRNA methylase family enzyme
MKKSPERRCTTCLTDIPLRLLAGDPVDKLRPDVIHMIQPNTRDKGNKRDIKNKNETNREVMGLMIGNKQTYKKPSKQEQKISKFS